MEYLFEDFKSIMIELYKQSTTSERRLLKKIVYKLELSETKKDEIWCEIVWRGGVVDDFEGM